MIALIIILSIMTQCLITGFVGRTMTHYIASKCNDDCANRLTDHSVNYHSEGYIYGFFWPILVPAMLGMSLSKRTAGPSRTERKHEKQITLAEHRLEIARIERQETEEVNRRLEAARR